MEPDRQLEIQLGHMCNNRCVFCVSGQRTALGEAGPMPAEPAIAKLREAHAQGIRRLTLLGGEPTLQPGFMDVVRAAVTLGFDEIVVFTNGAKTAREGFVDEVLATGGRFTWRLSLQGATAAAHDRTTRKLGSFERLVRTMDVLQRRQQPLTVNMCVVRSNHASIAAFPALLVPFGARQLHLDMVRPLDAGERSEDELRAMLPRYTDLVPHLDAMIAGFPDGFDVNVGNLPYCIAPHLAPWIHHDGEPTTTVSVDGDDRLGDGWDKYHVKRRDKLKPASCRTCAHDARCNGVFETYARFYGLDELVPVSDPTLVQLDARRALFALRVRRTVQCLVGWVPEGTRLPLEVRVEAGTGEAYVRGALADGRSVEFVLRAPGSGVAGTPWFSLHVLDADDTGEATVAWLGAVFARLCSMGPEATHPIGDDAGYPSARSREPGRALDARVGECLRRLRARAPFAPLVWTRVLVADDGREATAWLRAPGDAAVSLTVTAGAQGVSLRYGVEGTLPAAHRAEVTAAVRAAMEALRTPLAPRDDAAAKHAHARGHAG